MTEATATMNMVFRSANASIYDSPTPDHLDDIFASSKETPISPPADNKPDNVESKTKSHDELHVNIPDSEFIETLTTAADSLVPVITRSLSQLDTWCDIHGLEAVDSEHTQTTIARQAVFSLCLKTALYDYYYQQSELAALPSNTRDALQTAKDQTGNPAFKEFILDDIVWQGDDQALADVIDLRHRLAESTQPAEDIGRLYEAIIPNAARQHLGQHRTPPEIRDLMRSWAARNGEAVLDPGMGAGALSSPIHPRWRLLSDPEYVTGIERSPLAFLMGTVSLTLSRQAHETQLTDFLQITPADLSTRVSSIYCNPPFTRHQQLPADYKQTINAQAEQNTGLPIPRTSPLYAYFLYHSRQFLSSGDRAVFLTPQSFLAADYGIPLKRFLLREFDIKALVLFNPDSLSVFDDAMTTTLLLVLDARTPDEPAESTQFIRVDRMPGDGTLTQVVREEQEASIDWGLINCVPQSDLAPAQNWQTRFNPIDIDIDTSELPSLSEFVSVQRGASTGDVDFFCLSQDELAALGIDEQQCSRLIRRPMHLQGYDYRDADWEQARANGNEVWLVDPDEIAGVSADAEDVNTNCLGERSTRETDDGETPGGQSEICRYLKNGVRESKIHETHPASNRQFWYRPRRMPSARVLVDYAGRDRVTFVLNETAARNINNLYGFYDITIGEPALKALLAYLNSNIADTVVQQHRQMRDDGFANMNPSDVENVPAINLRELSDEAVTTLSDAFDELRETARRGDDCEPVVEHIDSLLQQYI